VLISGQPAFQVGMGGGAALFFARLGPRGAAVSSKIVALGSKAQKRHSLFFALRGDKRGAKVERER
jgi:hypothetical protein